MTVLRNLCLALPAFVAASMMASVPAAAQKKPNIVMLMTDDTGWNDFGAYTGGGAALGHPTPNIDRIAKAQKKERCSRAGTVRRAARLAVPHS
jgi:hypothetical protein